VTAFSSDAFFRAFRSEIVSLRALEGVYDLETAEADTASEAINVRRATMAVYPGFLGSVTPVCRVYLVVQYTSSGLNEGDVFEGTMRFNFFTRRFTFACVLSRLPRIEGPRFDVVIARAARRWAAEDPAHFERHRGGIRLIMSVSRPGATPLSNGGLSCTDILGVSREPTPQQRRRFLELQDQQRREAEVAISPVFKPAAPLPTAGSSGPGSLFVGTSVGDNSNGGGASSDSFGRGDSRAAAAIVGVGTPGQNRLPPPAGAPQGQKRTAQVAAFFASRFKGL
jgi:hypothetical protein